jgi:hypothetical protein
VADLDATREEQILDVPQGLRETDMTQTAVRTSAGLVLKQRRGLGLGMPGGQVAPCPAQRKFL